MTVFRKASLGGLQAGFIHLWGPSPCPVDGGRAVPSALAAGFLGKWPCVGVPWDAGVIITHPASSRRAATVTRAPRPLRQLAQHPAGGETESLSLAA